MIDTHTHLNFQAFDRDWQEVAERAIQNGVEKMIVVGTDVETSRKAVEIVEKHEALFAAIGVHPHHAKAYLSKNAEYAVQISETMGQVRDLVQHPRVVAVGEVGLDYHYYKNSARYKLENNEEELEWLKEIQRELLMAQIKLANEFDKPLILHSRETKDEVLNLLLEHKPKAGGVFHCFAGSKKYLARILEAGFYVSFTGNVTYVEDRTEVAKLMPLDRLLLETDCPYMLPEPMRVESRRQQEAGKDAIRCEPAFVQRTAKHLANAFDISIEELDKRTTENARRLFGF